MFEMRRFEPFRCTYACFNGPDFSADLAGHLHDNFGDDRVRVLRGPGEVSQELGGHHLTGNAISHAANLLDDVVDELVLARDHTYDKLWSTVLDVVGHFAAECCGVGAAAVDAQPLRGHVFKNLRGQ